MRPQVTEITNKKQNYAQTGPHKNIFLPVQSIHSCPTIIDMHSGSGKRTWGNIMGQTGPNKLKFV